MEIEPIYAASFMAVTILTTYYVLKRRKNMGCFAFGYIGLIIFSFNLFAVFSSLFMYNSCKDLYKISTSGEKYKGTVISYTIQEKRSSGNRQKHKMYQPTVQFTTQSGKEIQRELNFSTSGLKIGDTYNVNYNEEEDEIVVLGFTMVLRFVGSFIFFAIFSLLSAGGLRYALGYNMESYMRLLGNFGFLFFLPFLMILFDALLVYAVFYGNTVPFWVTIILVFFIVMLTLGIFGYLKMVFTKGKPKIKSSGAGSWTADWEDK